MKGFFTFWLFSLTSLLMGIDKQPLQLSSEKTNNPRRKPRARVVAISGAWIERFWNVTLGFYCAYCYWAPL